MFRGDIYSANTGLSRLQARALLAYRVDCEPIAGQRLVSRGGGSAPGGWVATRIVQVEHRLAGTPFTLRCR